MSYKIVEIRGRGVSSAMTEILFELATAKSERVELIRFNITPEADDTEHGYAKKLVLSIQRRLKDMKQLGKIQVYATRASFESSSTEAVFLLNKYPDILAETCLVDNSEYVIVKI